jgi:toxin ParE1/3/4
MYEVVKSPLAKDDLKGIWHYSFNKWGEDKAAEYLRQLNARMQGLGNNPEIGRPRDYIRQGYRSIQVNRHIIFYRLQGQEIDIIRVLHERMNAEKYLQN